MKAKLVFHERVIFPDGAIAEMVLWHVPKPVPPMTHGFKYSLYYGYPGIREIGYDNERGKGDHRHYRDREEPYEFRSMKQLIEDFIADVDVLRGGK